MIYHAINYIPNTKDDMLAVTQNLAIESILKFKPSNTTFVSMGFADEKNLEVADICVDFERDSSHITTNRRLPFVRDIFNLLSDKALADDWLGFTNSDIVIRDRLFYDILNNDKQHDVKLFNRLEIERVPLTSDLSVFLSYQGERNPYSGRDGFFIRKSLWDKLSTVLPDYIIGEPYWDIGFIELLSKQNLSLIQDRIYHYFHPRRWQRETPGALYNKQLYDQQFK